MFLLAKKILGVNAAQPQRGQRPLPPATPMAAQTPGTSP